MRRQSLKEFQDVLDDLSVELKNTSFLNLLEKRYISNKIKRMEQSLEDVYVNSFEFSDLCERYHEVIDHVCSLLEQLEITDPVSIFSAYSYMIRNGYLSYSHQFVYNKNIDEGLYLFGSNVISGAGVCRHICSFLTDIYCSMGYDSCNIGMFFHKGLETMERQKLKTIKNQLDSSSVSSVLKLLYFIHHGRFPFNHLVTLVTNSDGTLLLDPTNDVAFYVGANQSIHPVVEQDISLKCDYVPIFNNDQPCTLKHFLQETNFFVVNNVLNKFNDIWNFCEKYSSLFQYFYFDNYDLYRDVVEKRKVLVREFKRNMD